MGYLKPSVGERFEDFEKVSKRERSDSIFARSAKAKQTKRHNKTIMSTFPSICSLKLGPLTVTSKGSKQIQVYKDDGPLVWQPSEYLEVPFEPSNFADKDSSRVNICFVPTEEIKTCLELFESWCIKTLTKDAKELLGQELTESQIKEIFQTSLKTSEKGWTSFRCKMNIAGRNAVQCWTKDKVKRSRPESWRDCKITPKLHFKGLYVMGRDMGAVIEVTHAMVEELEQHCPFD